MDTESVLDVDAVTNYTNFPALTQGTYDSDTSSVILEHDMAHYVAAIEGHDKTVSLSFSRCR